MHKKNKNFRFLLVKKHLLIKKFFRTFISNLINTVYRLYRLSPNTAILAPTAYRVLFPTANLRIPPIVFYRLPPNGPQPPSLISTQSLTEKFFIGETPFKCPTCHKCFVQKGNLHRHKKIHISFKLNSFKFPFKGT